MTAVLKPEEVATLAEEINQLVKKEASVLGGKFADVLNEHKVAVPPEVPKDLSVVFATQVVLQGVANIACEVLTHLIGQWAAEQCHSALNSIVQTHNAMQREPEAIQ
jgi:hypothetical protein